MRRVLAIAFDHLGTPPDDVEVDVLGLWQPSVDMARAAHPLYEYDVVLLNPQSYSHLLFGRAGAQSGASNELSLLKRERNAYDIDEALSETERARNSEQP